jgi:hypothetical protein
MRQTHGRSEVAELADRQTGMGSCRGRRGAGAGVGES